MRCLLRTPRWNWFSFRRLAFNRVVAHPGDVRCCKHNLVLVTHAVLPGWHGTIGGTVFDDLGDVFDVTNVFPMVIGQVWANNTATIGPVSTDTIGCVYNFAYSAPFFFIHVLVNRCTIGFQLSDLLKFEFEN